jgi:hypothetical protein
MSAPYRVGFGEASSLEEYSGIPKGNLKTNPLSGICSHDVQIKKALWRRKSENDIRRIWQ